jgi:hypothetical protein
MTLRHEILLLDNSAEVAPARFLGPGVGGGSSR